MAEQKYRFNPETLNFERIRLTAWQRTRRVLLMLTPGLVVPGPAIVMEMDSTTVLFPGYEAAVDHVGNLLIRPQGQE